MARVIVS